MIERCPKLTSNTNNSGLGYDILSRPCHKEYGIWYRPIQEIHDFLNSMEITEYHFTVCQSDQGYGWHLGFNDPKNDPKLAASIRLICKLLS